MCNKLPTYTNNQKDGNRAASILKSIMLGFCLFDEIDQSQDLGTDFSTLSQVLSTILSNFILKYRPNREMAPENRVKYLI